MVRLLPIQILLCLIGSVNGIVSSFFATNAIGIRIVTAMASDVTYQSVLGLNVLIINI